MEDDGILNKAHALSRLILQTREAVDQQARLGFRSLFLPRGLDATLPRPKRPRAEASQRAETRSVNATSSDVAIQPADPTKSVVATPPIDAAQSEVGVPPSVSTQHPNTLDGVYQQYHHCTACALGHTRKNFVFGTGNPQARVMFIGEAPGAQEDQQGEVFVGAAGKLLTRILKAINFDRDEVYICNILKCRPPNNRDPQPAEIDACDAILKAQIEIINPPLICALGRVAAHALLKTNDSIRSLRSRFHDFNGAKLLVTYHPSSLLRNEAYKRPTWKDVQLLRKEYDRIVAAEVRLTRAETHE